MHELPAKGRTLGLRLCALVLAVSSASSIGGAKLGQLGVLFSRLRADELTDVVITEVMYNPASGDRREEFIELLNIGTQSYNLAGWSFTSGLSFTFPSVVLEPGAYLVVCADQNRIRQLYGITNTVGNWDAQTSLRNAGERIKLVNAGGVEVEDFTFDDRTPWPVLADGYGHSLERRNPYYDNDDPANWCASGFGSSWTRVIVTGLATSSKLYLYLMGAGTAYVDDVQIYPVGNPGNNRVQNGGFESGMQNWIAGGNHSQSTATTERARSGSRSLKIVATGTGSSSGTNLVYQDGLGLVNDDPYTLEFYVLIPAGNPSLMARLSGSTGAAEPIQIEVRGGGATPGRQNSAYSTDIPPFIYPGTHYPQRPVAATSVVLLAAVRDDFQVATVTAHWDAGSGERTAEMFDDGAHSDGLAEDGIYGAQIGSFATGSVVRYWFTATDNAGQEGRYPFLGNPTQALGFYVEPPGISPAFQARSNTGLVSELPPVYHLLIDPTYLDGPTTNPSPNSPHLKEPRTYVPCTFIFNGEVFDNVRVRHRGQTSLSRPKKHWKIDFNKDHRFRTPFAGHDEIDNFNLQSCEGDKSFLREWLEHKAMMDAGQPALEAWHVRLYLNGTYRGLYMHLENPDEDWLDRSGLDKDGWLWKSYSEAKSGSTSGFEMEEDGGDAARANAAFSSFLSQVNSLQGQALVDFINANMNVAGFTDFLAIHQLTHDADHPHKNYLVYADEDQPAGSWTFLLWDADLSHGRNFECSDCGLGSGVWNDCIRWDFWGDTKLLFGTAAKPKCDGPWNGVIDAFLNRTTAFREQYYVRVATLLEAQYHPSVLEPVIDDMYPPLVAEVALDWARNPPTYGRRNAPGDYPFHVSELKRWVGERYNYLSDALAVLRTPDVSGLHCLRVANDAVLTWTNGGTYDQIRVFRNSRAIATLPGSATQTVQPLDLSKPSNQFRVASVISGSVREGQTCSIVISSGTYTRVIDQTFDAPVPASELSMNCNATQTGGVLQLTSAEGNQVGSAFFLAQYPIDDFVAEFDFRLDDPGNRGADGLVFIVHTGTDPKRCGAAGGGMGYFDGDGGAPVFPGYAVVFDIWQNPGEPSDNWVGFVDADEASPRVRAADLPEELIANGTFHARVLGKAGEFRVLLSNASIGMAEREILSYSDSNFVPREAYFGFSAATGSAWVRHSVDNFTLRIASSQEQVLAEFRGEPLSGSVPLTVRFLNLSTNANSFLWEFGDGETSSEVHPVHTYAQPGTYTVKLTAYGSSETDVETKTAYISAYGVLKAEFTASPKLGLAPLSVTFTNLSTGASSYRWDFGDGATSALENPAHTYSSPGLYTVSLTAYGPGGASDTKTAVNYIQADAPVNADFEAFPRAGSAPLAVAFSDRSAGSTIVSRQWNFGDGATSTEPNPTHVYTKDGTYTVTLLVFGYSVSDAETKTGYIRVGSGGAPFVRGDANGDSRVDISDAIAALNYLFLGSADLSCPDAADADDSGDLNITDAIRILEYLFQGGAAFPPPFPASGPDPTPDSLPECAL